jgi:type III restriction enzyme
VLVVHSKAPDQALAQLAAVEEPESAVRVIISVGMLKEGWDVRNVYVIASMRSSVSEILTEQTLGRGMRLPYGRYTGTEILDTLEVVAHERYEELLRRAGILNQAFVDYRTRAALRVNAQGQQVVVSETIQAQSQPLIASSDGVAPPLAADEQPEPVVTTVEDRMSQVGAAVLAMRQEIAPRPDAPPIIVPVLRMTPIQSSFSLADITDTSRFRRLGESLAADPEGELARTLVSARVVSRADGMKRTELVTSTAADRVRTTATLFGEPELRERLAEMVLASPAIPARRDQQVALEPIMEAFLRGLGLKAEEILSANLNRSSSLWPRSSGNTWPSRHSMKS